MLGCKPSPNGEASSIPRISDQPFSLKIIPAPVVISELHFTLFLNFYLKPSSSWISDLEKKNPHKVLRDLLLFAPPPPTYESLSLIPCPMSSLTLHSSHTEPAPPGMFSPWGLCTRCFLYPGGSFPGDPWACSSTSFKFFLKCKLLRSSLNYLFKFEAAHHPSSQFPAFFFFVILSTTQTSRHLRCLLTCLLSFSLH